MNGHTHMDKHRQTQTRTDTHEYTLTCELRYTTAYSLDFFFYFPSLSRVLDVYL